MSHNTLSNIQTSLTLPLHPVQSIFLNRLIILLSILTSLLALLIVCISSNLVCMRMLCMHMGICLNVFYLARPVIFWVGHTSITVVHANTIVSMRWPGSSKTFNISVMELHKWLEIWHTCTLWPTKNISKSMFYSLVIVTERFSLWGSHKSILAVKTLFQTCLVTKLHTSILYCK